MKAKVIFAFWLTGAVGYIVASSIRWTVDHGGAWLVVAAVPLVWAPVTVFYVAGAVAIARGEE